MKIFVTERINRKLLSRLITKKFNGVVYLDADAGANETSFPELTLCHARKCYQEAGWHGYGILEKRIEAVRRKSPELITYQAIDLAAALVKDLYWRTSREFMLDYACGRFFPAATAIVRNKSPHVKDLIYCLYLLLNGYLKYIAALLSGRRRSVRENIHRKCLIRIEDKVTYVFYRNLLKELGYENITAFQINKPLEKETAALLSGHRIPSVDVSSIRASGFINPVSAARLMFMLPATQVKEIIEARTSVLDRVAQYEALAKCGAKVIINNAAECDSGGMVMGLTGKKYGITTINTMNGTKSRDAFNSGTGFDLWFVHDEGLKKMLCETYKLPPERIAVHGHLLEDEARGHRYGGSLDKYMDRIKGKRIISVFTQPLAVEERNGVLGFLRKLTGKENDILVLIRLHPVEKEDQFATETAGLLNGHMIILPYSRSATNESLFDLLLHTHVAISFASMVSYQASWLGVPSINFEYREQSVLTYIDGKKVIHINSTEALEPALKNAFSVSRGKGAEEISVSKKIAGEIRKYF